MTPEKTQLNTTLIKKDIITPSIAPESAVQLESLTNYSSKRRASDTNIRPSSIPVTKKANNLQKETKILFLA